MKYSIIVPVYKRPGEIEELLQSLVKQTYRNFEVIIVERDSGLLCSDVVKKFSAALDIKYYCIETTGRSHQRNYGMSKAEGEFFILFDSDCVIPEGYMMAVEENLTETPVDIFGGPDSADVSFTPMQKAINYSMTSFFTTGGIRGGMKDKTKFSPRSFNMGISRKAFEITGGFANMTGEDIDFSIRCREVGLRSLLFTDAFVYHKRRVDFQRFKKQVKTFGRARVILSRKHPSSFKVVHLFPACFVLGHIFLLLVFLSCLSSFPFISLLSLLPVIFYVVLLFADSLIKNKSIKIAWLSVCASYIQLGGYGLGFISEFLTGKAAAIIKEKGQEAGYQY